MFAPFMANAWIVGTVVALVAGVVGFFVVQRGSTFAAHAIPNGAFAGAAGANLVGIAPSIGLTGAAVVAALAIGSLARRARRDVATALTLVALLGLGAAMLSASGQYESSVISLLFGQILGVAPSRILPAVAVGAGVLVVLAAMYRPLLLSSLSRELSEVRGVRFATVDTIFLVVVALVTALSVPLVGALLTFSLMIGPAAAARTACRRPVQAVVVSAVLSVLTLWASIASSYFANWPVGFFVGVYSAAGFMTARLLVAWRENPRSN